ncbi:NADH-quinone oxidoreductase subunit 5 family protein [Saccharothrix sp. Mg75]|uniref:NADH-quinone oxidoreductase subunit 5 family protein n=1 Tax=Saccharothrix sp. Mg75 TaxID=3445357 RepID=UPI003EEF5023
MLLWMLVGVPVLIGSALAVVGRRADRLAPAAAVGTGVIVLALAVWASVSRPAASAPLLDGLPVGLAVDGLSAVMVLTVAAVLLAVLVFSAGEINDARARFFGLVLLFAGAMLVTVTATTMTALLMSWEVMGATSYALIGFWWRDENRVASGSVAFLTTRTADLGLYLAAGAMLAGGSGGLVLADLPGIEPGWRDVAATGVVVAALGKSAQLPFSFWLSRAMAGPSPVSALLHSATMVAAGAYLLLRVQPLLGATGWAAAVVAWVGALTALVLGAVAVVQRDLKQLLAASTCSQVGFMVLAAGAGGVAAGTGQLVAHAATKSLLFLCAGAWLSALGTKDLHALRGVGRRYPVVGVSFGVGAAALAGVPPLSIWFTKDAVLSSALHSSIALYVVGLAAAVASGLYAGRALFLLWGPPAVNPEFDTEERGTRVVTRLQQWPLPVLAVGAVGLGAVFGLGDSRWWETVLSAVIALVAVGSAASSTRDGSDVLGGRSRALSTWLYMNTLVSRGVGTPVVGLAGLLARFDDRVLDAGVRRGFGTPVIVLAGLLARFDDRVVDGGVRVTAGLSGAVARVADAKVDWSVDRLVRWIASVARGLGRVARRPQTGQLHHYYAQAVVALVVLALLAIVVGRG